MVSGFILLCFIISADGAKEENRRYIDGFQKAGERIVLTVDDFNPGAKKLYENLGYKCVGELPDFYKKGINCYLMMKRRG